MKKLGAVLGAVVVGVLWTVGSALAVDGYLMGDPAPGKVVPLYRANATTATLIGIENTEDNDGPLDPFGDDVLVHVTIFTSTSVEVTDFSLCLSPFDFGFVVLQSPSPNAAQLAELAIRGTKARVISVEADLIPAEGYVTIATVDEFASTDGTCVGRRFEAPFEGEQLAVWAILADVEDASFATEIPTPTALVDASTGEASGGFGAYGLIPNENRVIARFDVNPVVDSETEVFVWLTDNGLGRTNWPANLDCEDEFTQSTTINLSKELNVINPNALAGIGQCKLQGQYRGVLRFEMPEDGFLWSQITQQASSFRQNYMGYNLDSNHFIID